VPVTVTQTVDNALQASSVVSAVVEDVATTMAVGWYKLEMYAMESSTEERTPA
jgi:hypothetical protein